jgi:hypothetical protein
MCQQNAFSSNLASFGFDIFQSLVADPLHEFEIGVWKGLYTHLLRLLEALGKSDRIAELDERYAFPSFTPSHLPTHCFFPVY